MFCILFFVEKIEKLFLIEYNIVIDTYLSLFLLFKTTTIV